MTPVASDRAVGEEVHLMVDDPQTDAGERLVFRRGRLRTRDNDEAEILRRAVANLADTGRVKRILVEAGRIYSPLVDGPTVDLSTRRRVVELLEAGRVDEARAVLEERLRLFVRVDDPGRRESPQEPPSSPGGCPHADP